MGCLPRAAGQGGEEKTPPLYMSSQTRRVTKRLTP
jgi:hypothetical protein